MQGYDVIVLTAANEAQANGYRAQMDWRKANGLIDKQAEVYVITDPGGRRVGSLGATLHVLHELTKSLKPAATKKSIFEQRRILICHSGGDSRRTPAYAAQGKVFTPVPTVSSTGLPLALFDLILQTVSELPKPVNGHVLVTSGDVLLTFDHGSVDFSKPGVTGVAYFGPVDRGTRHGVYIPEMFAAQSHKTECLKVADFLQKPSPETAQARGAVDPFGRVAVDTGLISLDPATCQRLVDFACSSARSKTSLLTDIIAGTCPALDIYEELTMALAPRFTETLFLERFVSERGRDAAHGKRMHTFYQALQRIPFHVNIVPFCEFFHIGSSRELLSGFSTLSRTSQTYRFQNGSNACLEDINEAERAFVFNAYARSSLRTGSALIEGVDASACPFIRLAGDNILTGLPAEARTGITLEKGIGLVVLPIAKHDWAAIAYGLDDDFKTPFGGDKPCRFLNQPIDAWLSRNNVRAQQVWSGDEKEGLWRAKLWRIGSLEDVLQDALAVAKGEKWPSKARGKRFCIADVVPRVNHDRLLAVRHEILRQVNLFRVTQRLLADDTLAAETICSEIKTAQEALQLLRQLSTLLMDQAARKPLLRARILRLMAMIQTVHGHKGKPNEFGSAAVLQKEAFEAVAESVAISFTTPVKARPAAILHDQVVWVTTPVRIDFAGGWSDTPPICSEHGGTVLNAAVTLNGLYPIQVMAKLNTEGCIRLSSIDLGERKEIRTTAELLDHANPHDWDALAKAALILSGIGPSTEKQSLKSWLNTLGGGLDLTIFSALPKGSGMGTSSILGAAVVACLDCVLGVPYNADRIIRMTSILEQRMCTGGGWQDQVGGIMPGVKLIRTQPGPDQTVSLRWSVFGLSDDSELKQRSLLYFTGQKRMARNILQNVVGNYLARTPKSLQLVHELKANALETKEALDAKDIEGFARGVARYWEQKKAIDPGATNAPIENLLASIQQDVQASLLPGAGGGGFIFIIAKTAEAAHRIRATLNANPLNAHSRFFDFAIDGQGLKITVL